MERIYHSSVTWTINSFLNGPLETNETINSPEFVTNLIKPINWRLAINGMCKCGERYTTRILLKRSDSCSGPRHLAVKLRVSVINRNGFASNDICDASFYPGTERSFQSWQIYDTITDYYNSSRFYSGNIMITCDFLLDIALSFKQSAINADLRCLSNDLKTFHMTDNFTDLDLIVDGKTFAVHSIIVKARSKRIAEMLNENPWVTEIGIGPYGSALQIQGLIVYWYSGDMEKLPRTLSPSTSDFIENLGQLELRPYVQPEKINIFTNFQTLNLSIKWVIEDFQFCKSVKHIPKLKYILEEQPWKLYFYPKGPTGNANYVSFCIKEKSTTGAFKSVYVEIFLTDENNLEYICQSTVSWLHVPGKYYFSGFLFHQDFDFFVYHMFKDNILRIGCRIKYGTGNVKYHTQYVSSSQTMNVKKEHPYTTLASNLKWLLQSGDMSDITLKAGDRIFKVHTPIIAARSRYFAQLVINRKLDPNRPDEVELRDIEPGDLDVILKYMYYAEKIQLNQDLALRLYPVVHEYGIPILKTFCSEYLQSHLAVGNSVAALELADKYKDSALKRTALEIIYANWDHISNTERWHELQNDNAKLALEIMSELMSRICSFKPST